MKVFHFYSKRDNNKESISNYKTNSIEDAIVYFSKLKGLDIQTFLSIYNVEIKQVS